MVGSVYNPDNSEWTHWSFDENFYVSADFTPKLKVLFIFENNCKTVVPRTIVAGDILTFVADFKNLDSTSQVKSFDIGGISCDRSDFEEQHLTGFSFVPCRVPKETP